jgi:O-acetyl-ADP-ribose deacetylase (regulator of RNase III)
MARLPEEKTIKVRLVLCDREPEVLACWRSQFCEKHPEVEVRAGSILEAGTAAVVCPGNAFGFMDGGLGLHLSEALGWHLQDELRAAVHRRFDGELLVGQALVIRTGAAGAAGAAGTAGAAPQWLVYAPTARTPSSVEGTLNAYLAMRGALLAVRDHNLEAVEAPIASLAVPGLCTGAGGMHRLISARQMRYAYELVAGLRGAGSKNLSGLARREAKLRSLPASAAEED